MTSNEISHFFRRYKNIKISSKNHYHGSWFIPENYDNGTTLSGEFYNSHLNSQHRAMIDFSVEMYIDWTIVSLSANVTTQTVSPAPTNTGPSVTNATSNRTSRQHAEDFFKSIVGKKIKRNSWHPDSWFIAQTLQADPSIKAEGEFYNGNSKKTLTGLNSSTFLDRDFGINTNDFTLLPGTPQIVNSSATNLDKQVKEFFEKVKGKKIRYIGTGNPGWHEKSWFIPDSIGLDGYKGFHTYMIGQKYTESTRGYDNNARYTINSFSSWQILDEAPGLNTSCNHAEIGTYIGFRESYKYCKTCDHKLGMIDLRDLNNMMGRIDKV